ncbi:class A beta-lactamase [Streptomyces microflavus]|uniref:Beta-lactamase n=1 Tax=Streptomyces microflavus TaxID=1919 RepID=A0A6N9VIF6_STRMI|nr:MULTISPECIES: class A beta-lactamase [Streptomyces]MBW3363308.1 class A beta-lactamase [Streptomyces sp. 09ZI22]MEE1731228.1 class A beta-lactamase [Streptomyces sp. BE282]NEB69841.1 class A beta-lactamase [Streptomyces microflavus]QQZ58469.1 class A beta-lactamase [Streptomyces microflavus]WTF73982.1 class A beta-lactamase [Streptomyces microflavus]
MPTRTAASTRTPAHVSRRSALAALAGAALLPLAGCSAAGPDSVTDGRSGPSRSGPGPSPSAPALPRTDRAFAGLERKFDARLGVYAVDTGDGRIVAHRPDERFAYASTCKALLAGAVLAKKSLPQMERLVRYGKEEIISNSPITEKHVATGMTLRELCDAAIRYSDNAAANLLFRELGGPRGLQDALRGLGDRVTRCDRYEVALSDATPGDLRDTSTPRALATDLRAYVLGPALPAAKQAVLADWLKRNTTGDHTIRAGTPRGWEVGDKTGTGGYGTRNDIAIVRPPGGAAPIALAVLSRRDTKDAEPQDALIAGAAKIALEAFA